MPAPADQLLQQALAAHRRGAVAEAAPLYRRVLEIAPANNVACTNLAVIATAAGDFDEAETMFRRVVEIQPDSPEAHYNLGFILQERGKLDAAIEVYRRALALRPDMPQAHTNLGVALQHQGKLDDAVAAFRQAIAGNPKHADAYFNLGAVLRLQNHVDEAAAAYRRVIELEPSHAAARNNLALILSEAGEPSAADVLLRKAVGRWPDYAEGHNNLGALLLDQGRPQEALDALQAALKRTPDYPEAHLNMGNALRELGSLAEAIGAYSRAIELRPAYAEALAQLVYHRARACDWTDAAAAEATLLSVVRQNAARIPPFMLMATAATGADQLLCARKWVEHFTVPEQQVFAHRAAPRAGCLRVGYLSSDFHNHATAYLMAELIERHDRDRFEIHGYSYGADSGGDMRARLVSAFDRFTDIDALAHRDAAARIRADDVDILVDLKGHTHRARPKILAFRPAPVQVNYLGYPGTMGAPFIDYIVADDFIVPRERQMLFAEKLAYLPDCYQPNDTRREIAATPSRADCGLPAQGFVFCAFNNSFKITPAFFAIWMRLLQQVPGSVLWLLESNALVRSNLGAAAVAAGVDPTRLVFAPILPRGHHLARHRHADLFLDTLPCNAHTTASDALWAGLPVLTCAGETFAGRVAGSIVRAAGLAELVTNSPRDYEALALKLANEPARLAGIRSRLGAGRENLPLFDMGKRTRDLEALYARMAETWRSGRPAAPITLS
ncbi:MAG: tetratricopeptide repeat protein [Xanthobacteraceae bacterium]